MAQWAKGESGNPGGRPNGLGEIREIARQHTDTAIETLVKVMNATDASPSARVAAASALLDRGWGRPLQVSRLRAYSIYRARCRNFQNVCIANKERNSPAPKNSRP